MKIKSVKRVPATWKPDSSESSLSELLLCIPKTVNLRDLAQGKDEKSFPFLGPLDDFIETNRKLESFPQDFRTF